MDHTLEAVNFWPLVEVKTQSCFGFRYFRHVCRDVSRSADTSAGSGIFGRRVPDLPVLWCHGWREIAHLRICGARKGPQESSKEKKPSQLPRCRLSSGNIRDLLFKRFHGCSWNMQLRLPCIDASESKFELQGPKLSPDFCRPPPTNSSSSVSSFGIRCKCDAQFKGAPPTCPFR